jgi:hypothetical protein
MMHLQEAIKKIFTQLHAILEELSDDQYSVALPVILNASIGQHVRHIIELFIELDAGYMSGIINYDKRKRDHRIEIDRLFAGEVLQSVQTRLNNVNKALMLEVGYNEGNAGPTIVQTNYCRELIYNLEHAVHHMALIRIGINAVSTIKVAADFGIAASTVKYHATCAQ